MVREAERRFRANLIEWGKRNRREFPWREPSRSLYEVFVAEFFLTQTPADNVAAVYPEFLRRFPSLRAIERTAEEDIVDVIEPLGFQNMRAEALKQIASGWGQLPTAPGRLNDLPRVGPYVSNATLCFALGERLPILDRNVERVYGRAFRDRWPKKQTDKMEFVRRLLPEEPREYNLALLDFGASICRPEPLCGSCVARHHCIHYTESVKESR